ncbi:8-oxoguanine DNA glycosylase OGG fold protein [Mycobacterium kansasii]
MESSRLSSAPWSGVTATGGYGPTRVRWILSGIKTGARAAPIRGDVAIRLRTAADTVRDQGPVDGFRYLNNAGRINGAAFFTKWLYFASALTNADDPCAAPILDKQVSDWLEREASISLKIHRTPDYKRYLDILKDWGGD